VVEEIEGVQVPYTATCAVRKPGGNTESISYLVVGEFCMMLKVFSHTKPPRHEAFYQAVADHPRDGHRRRRDHGRFPFILVSLWYLCDFV